MRQGAPGLGGSRAACKTPVATTVPRRAHRGPKRWAGHAPCYLGDLALKPVCPPPPLHGLLSNSLSWTTPWRACRAEAGVTVCCCRNCPGSPKCYSSKVRCSRQACRPVLYGPEGMALIPQVHEITPYAKVAKLLRDADFTVDISMSGIPSDNEVLLAVTCDMHKVKVAAEEQEYPAELCGTLRACKRRYQVKKDHLFVPFGSLKRRDITLAMMQEVFEVQRYLESGIIKRMYPLHDPRERMQVQKHWLPRKRFRIPPFTFAADLLFERSQVHPPSHTQGVM